MTMKSRRLESRQWVEGEIRFTGGLDSRMIGLLRAIEQSGSINQAARQTGLSYKGAWQMIERANNRSPKILVSTAIGGCKGGGTSLTEDGRAMLALFDRIERQHDEFLEQLNRSLSDNADAVLLLNRLIVKTSVRNQLFGRIVEIRHGSVNAEVSVQLKGGERVVAIVNQSSVNEQAYSIDTDALLLINSADITLATDTGDNRLSVPNRLSGSVLQVHQDAIDCEVVVKLKGGELLAAVITRQSLTQLALKPDVQVSLLFGGNVPILGIATGE